MTDEDPVPQDREVAGRDVGQRALNARVRRSSPPPSLLRAISFALLILGWFFAAWIVALHFARPSAVLPFPTEVVSDFPKMAIFLGPGTPLTAANAGIVVIQNTVASLTRLFLGIGIGAMLGFGTGLVLGWSRQLRLMLQGPLLLVRTIPLLALIPLFLVWFGGSDVGIVAFMAFSVFCMLLINTISAIGHASPLMQDFARTLGASRLRVYRTVVVPMIVPELAGGFRVVLALAWAILLGGEFLEAQSGLGHILILAVEFSYTSRMIFIVLLIAFYSFVVDAAFGVVRRWATRWMPD